MIYSICSQEGIQLLCYPIQGILRKRLVCKSLFDYDTRHLTWPDSAVQGMHFVSWLVAITTVVTRVISCYYWWCLISLMNTEKNKITYKRCYFWVSILSMYV